MVNLVFANWCLAEEWGAWTRESGEFSDKVEVNYVTINKFKEINLRNYLEYGLTDSITAFSSITYMWDSNHFHSTTYDNTSAVGQWVTTDTTIKANGFGDFDLGLKHRIIRGDFGSLSHAIKGKIPGPYDKNDPLPLGNGEYELEYHMMYGYSLYQWFPGYLNFDAGYRLRFDGLRDQIAYGAEFGTFFGDHLFAQVRFSGAHKLDNGKTETVTLNPTITTEHAKTLPACGGDGGALLGSGGTSSADSTTDTKSVLLALGYKFNEHWVVKFKYRPSLEAENGDEGTSYSGSIIYLFK